MKYAYSIFVAVIVVLSLSVDWYFGLSITLFVTTLLYMLDGLGKRIVMRELIALHALFICLVVPILGYTMFSRDNYMARLWVRFMPVSEDQYYSFALPALGLYTIALCWPIDNGKISDAGPILQDTLTKVKTRLKEMPYTSLYIISLGIVMSVIAPVLPVSLQFFATLFYWSAFAGILYLFFTPDFKFKKVLLLVFTLFILSNSLRTGMFTIVAYMGLALFSFLFLGQKTPLWKKLSVFVLLIFAVFLVQSVKGKFRAYTWRQGYAGSKTALFGKLISDQLNKDESIFSSESLFPLYYRANQGYNVSLVMRRFPRQVPHDYGTNLSRSLAASVVPRFMWPDKPEAGGKYNMKYYAGFNLSGYSTNVGPLGEAYGSFGAAGGIIFMGVLGLFIRKAYSIVFKVAKRIPLIICWFPVFFFQITYSAENDTLQILNSLIKSVVFVYIVYKVVPQVFHATAKKVMARKKQAVTT